MPSLGVRLASSELLLARRGGTALRNTSSWRRGDFRNRRASGWQKRGRRGELTGFTCERRFNRDHPVSGAVFIQQTPPDGHFRAESFLLSLSFLLPPVERFPFCITRFLIGVQALVLISAAQTLGRRRFVVRIRAQFFTQLGRTLVLKAYFYRSRSRRMEAIVMIFSLESSG